MNAPALTKHVLIQDTRRTRYGAFEVTLISPTSGGRSAGWTCHARSRPR
ncbi:MAG: hypothetical protein ACKOD3_08775 [Phenylobacterium sp.]